MQQVRLLIDAGGQTTPMRSLCLFKAGHQRGRGGFGHDLYREMNPIAPVLGHLIVVENLAHGGVFLLPCRVWRVFSN
jgi:hypothetical protein